MADLICTNTTCPEYLILKANQFGMAAADVVCGTCGQAASDDDGSGVDAANRPNPDVPLVLPDPNA